MSNRITWKLLRNLKIAKIISEAELDIWWKYNLRNPITRIMFCVLIPIAIVVGLAESVIKAMIDIIGSALSEMTECHSIFKSELQGDKHALRRKEKWVRAPRFAYQSVEKRTWSR